MPINELEDIKNQLVLKMIPLSIYLFGSFADNTYTEHSDLDLYIVVDDNEKDLVELTSRAYKAIRQVKQHPVDIIVGTKSRFETRKNMKSIENEVYRKGVLLYDARSRELA